MGRIGTPELLIILAIVLLLFGPKALPKLGSYFGKSLGRFKRYVKSNWKTDTE